MNFDGETGRWRGAAGSRLLAGLFTLLAVGSAVLAVYMRNWSLIGLVIAMAVAGCLTLWSVEIDGRGVSARSAYGWPRVHVTTDEIDSVTVIDVHPLRDWAGWGLRFNRKGDTGIVLRSGSAVSINGKNGRRTVITAQRSEQAADALNQVLDKR